MKGDVKRLFDGVSAEVTIPEHLRERHLAAIRRELASPPVGAARGVSWFVRHRAALAWLTTGITAMPVAAVASQDALPGEVLYPVKRAVEVVAEPFFPRIQAVHRVEELERLAEAGVEDDVIEQALAAARAAIAATGADDLAPRLEEIAGGVFGDDEEDHPVGSTTTTVAGDEEDRGDDVETSTTTTTSVAEGEDDADDEADREDRDHDDHDDDTKDDDDSKDDDTRDDEDQDDDEKNEDDDDGNGDKQKNDDSDDGDSESGGD